MSFSVCQFSNILAFHFHPALGWKAWNVLDMLYVCVKQNKMFFQFRSGIAKMTYFDILSRIILAFGNKYWFIPNSFISKLSFQFENGIKMTFTAEMSIEKKMFQLKLTYRNKTFWFKISPCGGVKSIFCCYQTHFLLNGIDFHETRVSYNSSNNLLSAKQLNHFSTRHYCLKSGRSAADPVCAAMQT